ncbi:MAG: hypothetical protein DRI71_09665 [Bacteroidetes bacterium]|nr:MAG: hypothetical protein DRI71_09665 [Bacteroidota bacterium]
MRDSIYFVLILVISWSCANRVQPTGGPKDEDPPEVVSSTPEHGQRNFKQQEISIEFNEHVTFKSLKEQLLITPRITGEYDYKINKRTITLEFEEPFTDSTTYTLNFRDGIVDLTEGNPAENLLLAFSTGDMLDTLEISGNVVNLFTKEPIDGITVGLYDINDTLDIFSGPPYYLTKTNAEGNYQFKNLKDNTYKLYAFADGNKNLTAQSDRESYGFLPELIELDTAYVADTLDIHNLNIDTLEITRTRLSGRYFLVSTNKYLTNVKLEAENDSTIIYKYADDRQGVKIYNTFPIKDSLMVFSVMEDSLGLILEDTFHLSFSETTRKADEFKIRFKEPKGSIKKKIIVGEIGFDKPLQSITLDSVSIKRDSLEQYYIHKSFSYSLDTLENIIKYTISIPATVLDSLTKNRSPQTSASFSRAPAVKTSKITYQLVLPANTFITVEEDSSKQISKKIKFIEAEKTGILIGNINTTYNSYFIQLLDNKYNLIKEQEGGKKYSFDEIKPGEYIIRILVDENENGKWDPGDIRINKPHEKVIIYKDATGTSITAIRANWEITVDLTF